MIHITDGLVISNKNLCIQLIKININELALDKHNSLLKVQYDKNIEQIAKNAKLIQENIELIKNKSKTIHLAYDFDFLSKMFKELTTLSTTTILQ